MQTGWKLAVAISGLALITASCNAAGLFDADPPSGLVLSVPGGEWGHDDTIQVVLRNESDRPLGYNLCMKLLERRENGRWQAVQTLPENTACTAQLNVLEPGESVVGPQVVYSFIQEGTYRFRTGVEWPLNDGNVELVSNEFRVRDL